MRRPLRVRDEALLLRRPRRQLHAADLHGALRHLLHRDAILGGGGHGCEAVFGAAVHGETKTEQNTTSGRLGEATYTCFDGMWTLQPGSVCEGAPCELPWSGSIEHGESETAYSSESTNCQDFCPHEERECEYGELLGDPDYEHDSCSIEVGTTCQDGSLYAGLFNGDHYYTLASDVGEHTWNRGERLVVYTHADSETDGRANTTLLAGLIDDASPYYAALACHDLDQHGHSDWFLPAKDELYMLWENRDEIGGFDTTGHPEPAYYWSSTESGGDSAWTLQFHDGFHSQVTKNGDFLVRCVRR